MLLESLVEKKWAELEKYSKKQKGFQRIKLMKDISLQIQETEQIQNMINSNNICQDI